MSFSDDQLKRGETVPASVTPLTTEAYGRLFGACLSENFRPADAVEMLDNIERWKRLGVMS